MLPAPQFLWKQVGEACKGFPVRGGAGESFVEACVENEISPRGVANRPQVSDGVAVQERLRESPDFSRNCETFADRVRDRERLAELQTVDVRNFVDHFVED